MKVFFSRMVFLLTLLLPISGYSFSPEQKLSDESMEERAMKLFTEVRCIACQGQAIESSNSEFASQMRRSIRAKINSNKTDEQIKNELVEEFGDDILLKPNLFHNPLLWALPLICVIYGFILLMKLFRKKEEE